MGRKGATYMSAIVEKEGWAAKVEGFGKLEMRIAKCQRGYLSDISCRKILDNLYIPAVGKRMLEEIVGLVSPESCQVYSDD